jgi:hypothetical protein
MFFVRAAFWIFLILLLMPTTDKEKSDFYVAAGRTLSDLGGFCDRNPDVCDKTSAIFETILHKVRTSVKMLEDMIRSENADHDPAALSRGRPGDPRMQRGTGLDPRIAPAAVSSQQTLRADDLEPTWRGPGGI